MIRRISDTKNESNPKKKGRFNENEETEAFVRLNGEQSVQQQQSSNTIASDNEAEVVHLAAPEFDEQSPDIYKLPVELIMEIFAFLRMSDLDAVCKTSKWWQKVALVCYQQNYPFNYYTFYRKENLLYQIRTFDQFAFKQFLKSICFANSGDFQYFLDNEKEFHQLREIKLFGLKDLPKIEYLKPVLSKLEHLHVYKCEVEPKFVENILALCLNLKYFCWMQSCNTKTGAEWLLHKFPNLNRFGINAATEVYPITTFLELNPNIRSFEINSKNLWRNRKTLKASKVTLDDLAVSIDSKHITKWHSHHTNKERFASICRLLNELHELGLYKRLKLYVYLGFKQELVPDVASLKALVKLYIYHAKKGPFALSTLRTIEEINVREGSDINDIEAMASSLVKLKIMHIRRTDLKSIMSVISRAIKLEILIIGCLRKHEVINVATLNKARSKLLNAEKLTIYVSEYDFLATKRTHREVESGLIKIRRLESLDWDHGFAQCITRS